MGLTRVEIVMPANAGILDESSPAPWAPAFAGATNRYACRRMNSRIRGAIASRHLRPLKMP